MLGAVSAVSPLPTAGCRLQFAAISRLTRLVPRCDWVNADALTTLSVARLTLPRPSRRLFRRDHDDTVGTVRAVLGQFVRELQHFDVGDIVRREPVDAAIGSDLHWRSVDHVQRHAIADHPAVNPNQESRAACRNYVDPWKMPSSGVGCRLGALS